MAVRSILEIPHPALRQRARKVRNIDSSTLKLAYDMVDTMREARGVGLAANQVGVLKRLIVVQLPEEEEASIYVNPEILHREGEREIEEGCLSIPGYKGIITRSVWVRFRAMDHTSKVVKIKAEELLSQTLEHEVDHLNGILYSDHLKEHEQLTPVSAEPEDDQGSGDAEEGNGSGYMAEGAVGVTSPDAPAVASGPAGNDEVPASLKIR